MLKKLTLFLLVPILTLSCLNANEQFVPPKIKATPSVLGHIFKDSSGHFTQDTPENRSFIESAATYPEYRAGTNRFGEDIYLRTMPDGPQAWAYVRNGIIKDGGRNYFPKAWVPDSSHTGGHFITPKFNVYQQNSKTFQGHLAANKLNAEYARLSKTPQFASPIHESSVLGVTGEYGTISNLITQNLFQGKHTLALPVEILTQEEVFEVLRDVAKGIYVYNALPFFSLHFNHHLTSYPVIHPVHRHTLTGEAIAILDYYMKGFTTGRCFDIDFINTWDNTRNRNLDYLLQQSFTFKEYCSSLNIPYKTFDEILIEVMGDDCNNGGFVECFDLSYRIISKQNSIIQEDGTVYFAPDFDITYSLLGSPCTAKGEKHYNYLRQAAEIMCSQIKDVLPQLPICKRYFEVLHLANCFSYYCNTLKEAHKIPMLSRTSQTLIPRGCPKTFPPIPLSQDSDIKIGFMNFLKTLTPQEYEQCITYFTSASPSESEIHDAAYAVYYGIKDYLTKYTSCTTPTPNHCQYLMEQILIFCRDRYHIVKEEVTDILEDAQIYAAADDPNTQQKFASKSERLLSVAYTERRNGCHFRQNWYEKLSYGLVCKCFCRTI